MKPTKHNAGGRHGQQFQRHGVVYGHVRGQHEFVAPVAKSAGLSVEQTTALLGTLSNAGIKGSAAGTALRRIISELGNVEGVGPAIARLAKEGLNLADAKDEVGRNAQSALLVLAEGVDTRPN